MFGRFSVIVRSLGLRWQDSLKDRNGLPRVRVGQIQAHASGFQTNQKHGDGTFVEATDFRLSVFHRSVQVTEVRLSFLQLLPKQAEQAGELAKNQHTVISVEDLLQKLSKHGRFAGGFLRRLGKL